MKATAILQGRLGSRRLKDKIILPLADKPVIVHVYERIKYCKNIDRIIIATTTKKRDDVIAKLFEGFGVVVFRGKEEDPLDRFFQAASKYNLKHIVRVMADCPLIDPWVVDRVIEHYFEGNYDVCFLEGEFPSGLDVSVFSYLALKRAWEKARNPLEREHVIPYMQKHPEFFRTGILELFRGLLNHRWVLDYEEDYKFLTEVYKELYRPESIFTTPDVLKLLERRPQLAKLNAHIPRTVID